MITESDEISSIFIINHFGTNKGDAAILTGMIDALEHTIPNVKMAVESSDPDLTTERIGGRARIVERVVERKDQRNLLSWGIITLSWIFQGIIWSTLKRFKIDIKWLLNKEKRSLLSEYEKADIVLSVGGGYIRDNSGLTGYLPLYSIMLAHIIQKPVMLYAQSIEPINNRIYKFISKSFLNKSCLITLRDVASKETLKEMAITKPPIFITSDAAFYFHQKVNPQRAKAILSQEGICKRDYKLAGITLLRWHYPKKINPESKHENYKKIIAEISDYLVENLSMMVVFISMNTREWREDDIDLAREIVQMMKHKEYAKIIIGEYTPEEIKDIISQTDLVVGTRFHSLIFAATVGVPVLSIMYENKAVGIMKMLNMEKFVCDIADLDKNDLISKINEVWHKKNEIKSELESNVNLLQELALLNAKFVKQIIESSNKKTDSSDFSFELPQEDASILQRFN